MKVINIDDFKKIINQQKEKIQNEINKINNKNGILGVDFYRNYLEGKQQLIKYIENVIEILNFEVFNDDKK